MGALQKNFWENVLSGSISFSHRHKDFEIALSDEGALELYLDGCLRKKRERGAKEPQYVWTNVELEWEEQEELHPVLNATPDGGERVEHRHGGQAPRFF